MRKPRLRMNTRNVASRPITSSGRFGRREARLAKRSSITIGTIDVSRPLPSSAEPVIHGFCSGVEPSQMGEAGGLKSGGLSYYHILWLQESKAQNLEFFCRFRKYMIGKRLTESSPGRQPQLVVWTSCHFLSVDQDVVPFGSREIACGDERFICSLFVRSHRAN